ncbi:MAG: DUF721 domain-containing protein [Micavibrio aeruginosavorus]|uniref:DUF721 domain-containing protein n=1 Tax=Micavibrio aeruginosavorus TaxID=349221 RepID=A0A2W5A2M3_9BACT|nr:MAG: DUF721 domain-containing protein [Micavibrio aeruginosavorus]
MKPVSRSVPTLLAKAFQRKYIALGRIVTHWTEVVGPDFAERAQPAKIHYSKAKTPKEKSTATLDIAASSADCAVLVYQKDVILQRINHLFGDGWVTDIKFIHVEPKRPSKPPKRIKPLTSDEKNHLSQILETVDDPDIKERLARLGQSILQESKK